MRSAIGRRCVFAESVPSRINDPIKSAIVVVMQRLHIDDVSGIIEKLDLPYTKIMLPMEFEEARRCVTPIAKDPRRTEGELLFPQRFPREVVERDKIPLGPNGVAGQYQQRPFRRGGSAFKIAWFNDCYVPAAPKGTRWVRHWDLAGSKRKNVGAYAQAWTAGVKIGKGPGEDGDYYVGHVYRLQDEGDEVRKAIKMMALLDGASVRISLPQDPGQAGKLQARDMIKMLSGYRVRATIESGSKEVRAEPYASMWAGGCVKIVKTGDRVKDAWIEPYVAELLAFPGSPVKDQVDASSSAFLALQGPNVDNRNGVEIGIHSSGREDIGGVGLASPDAGVAEMQQLYRRRGERRVRRRWLQRARESILIATIVALTDWPRFRAYQAAACKQNSPSDNLIVFQVTQQNQCVGS